MRPEIELPDYSSASTVEVDEVEASDEDVEERLTALRERFGTLVGVERAVEDGDFVSIDLDAKIGDEEIDSVTGVSYEVGTKQHARRPRRGARRHDRRRDQDLHRARWPAATARARTPTSPSPCSRSRSASCPSSTTTSPSWPPSSTPSTSCKADVTKQAEQAKKFEQGVQARDKVLEQLLETDRRPGPRRHRRGRGAPATSRARTASRTTSTAPRSTRAPARRSRPSSSSTPSPRRRRSRSSSPSSSSTSS